MILENTSGKKCCELQEETRSRTHPDPSRIPKLHGRDGQWAMGAFAQPGALMAGTSNTFTYLVCTCPHIIARLGMLFLSDTRDEHTSSVQPIHAHMQDLSQDEDWTQGNACMTGEECDMDIDDVDDCDTDADPNI